MTQSELNRKAFKDLLIKYIRNTTYNIMKNEKSFENGKIYQIVNDFSDDIYIGSTCSPLSKRLYGHKTDCDKARHAERRLLKLATEHGWHHFSIRLLECYPCEDNEQLRMREQYYIDKVKQDAPHLCLNMINAYTSEADKYKMKRATKVIWIENNRDKYNEYNKQYQQRPHVVAYRKEYEKKNKDVHNRQGRDRYYFQMSWGGDHRYHNNLLQIDTKIFE